MFKLQRNFILTIIAIILLVFVSKIAFAGDNIPSNKEVEYAKKLYLMMRDFDNKEAKFAADAKTIPATDDYRMKQLFKNKFAYTKDYYMAISSLTPTSKFTATHQGLLESVYGTLQYLQKVVEGLEKGRKLQDIHIEYNNTFKEVNLKYTEVVKNFVDIIKSWQKPYIKKVMPPDMKPPASQ